MLCYRHPKESKKNREKAGKLISKCFLYSLTLVCLLFVDTWARPIFGLTANLKKMTRDERERRETTLTSLLQPAGD